MNRSSLPDYLRRMSKREQYAGQGESAILAKELQVNLRVFSTVGQVAEEASGGGRSIWIADHIALQARVHSSLLATEGVAAMSECTASCARCVLQQARRCCSACRRRRRA